jgi:hypothetical protein
MDFSASRVARYFTANSMAQHHSFQTICYAYAGGMLYTCAQIYEIGNTQGDLDGFISASLGV